MSSEQDPVEKLLQMYYKLSRVGEYPTGPEVDINEYKTIITQLRSEHAISERLKDFNEYLYKLSTDGKLTSQGQGILIHLGNWVNHGDQRFNPENYKKENII